MCQMLARFGVARLQSRDPGPGFRVTSRTPSLARHFALRTAQSCLARCHGRWQRYLSAVRHRKGHCDTAVDTDSTRRDIVFGNVPAMRDRDLPAATGAAAQGGVADIDCAPFTAAQGPGVAVTDPSDLGDPDLGPFFFFCLVFFLE